MSLNPPKVSPKHTMPIKRIDFNQMVMRKQYVGEG